MLNLLRLEGAISSGERTKEGRIALMEGAERDRPMAADGRRVGRLHGKRYAELLTNGEARQALRKAIEVEGTGCRDAWGNGFVKGLHDALSELEGKGNLARLDWDD
jgi:hypothetical protein